MTDRGACSERVPTQYEQQKHRRIPPSEAGTVSGTNVKCDEKRWPVARTRRVAAVRRSSGRINCSAMLCVVPARARGRSAMNSSATTTTTTTTAPGPVAGGAISCSLLRQPPRLGRPHSETWGRILCVLELSLGLTRKIRPLIGQEEATNQSGVGGFKLSLGPKLKTAYRTLKLKTKAQAYREKMRPPSGYWSVDNHSGATFPGQSTDLGLYHCAWLWRVIRKRPFHGLLSESQFLQHQRNDRGFF